MASIDAGILPRITSQTDDLLALERIWNWADSGPIQGQK